MAFTTILAGTELARPGTGPPPHVPARTVSKVIYHQHHSRSFAAHFPPCLRGERLLHAGGEGAVEVAAGELAVALDRRAAFGGERGGDYAGPAADHVHGIG